LPPPPPLVLSPLDLLERVVVGLDRLQARRQLQLGPTHLLLEIPV